MVTFCPSVNVPAPADAPRSTGRQYKPSPVNCAKLPICLKSSNELGLVLVEMKTPTVRRNNALVSPNVVPAGANLSSLGAQTSN